jgi:hypothetical protein
MKFTVEYLVGWHDIFKGHEKRLSKGFGLCYEESKNASSYQIDAPLVCAVSLFTTALEKCT